MIRIIARELSKYALALAMPICVFAADAHAGNLYRYTNNNGITVLDDRVPPAYVGKGYQVLSKSGRVVEVVPAHTDKPEGSSEQQIEAENQRLREDKYILASYSTVEEIRQTGKRKANLLEREIRIVEGKLSDMREQRDKEHVRAANHQRSGRVVPESLKVTLLELDQGVDKALLMLEERGKEHAEVKALYDSYELRFVELTGIDSEQIEATNTTGSSLK